MRKVALIFSVSVVGWAALTLPDFDATALYEARASGATDISDRRYYLRSDAPTPPAIPARAYIVADLESGDIILQKSPDSAFPIASVTKLLTAMSALSLGLDDESLLYPLLLESSNATAEKIASRRGRREFMRSMSKLAADIGMSNTTLEDPSGISPRNVSSPRDLLLMLQRLYKEQSELLALTLTPQRDKWVNSNLFVQRRHSDYIGGKSGYTPEAGGTLVSVFTLPLGELERPVAVILLGTKSEKGVKYELAQSIIDYVKQNVYYK